MMDEPVYPWAEVLHRGSIVCEAHYEQGRWRLIEPPAHFTELAPTVVDVREMLTDRVFPAQLETEFGSFYVREVENA